MSLDITLKKHFNKVDSNLLINDRSILNQHFSKEEDKIALDDVLDNYLTKIYDDGLRDFIGGHLKNFLIDCGIFSIRFSLNENFYSIWLTVRTTSWDFNYERSDIHDLISSVLIIILKGFGNISSSQIYLLNGFTEIASEIYAKYITFGRQNLYYFKLDDVKIEQIEAIVKSSIITNYILITHLNLVPGSSMDFNRHRAEESFGQEWAYKIAEYLEEDLESDHIGFMSRINPSWRWYHSIDSGVSIFELNEPILQSIKLYTVNKKQSEVDGPNKKIIIYPNELRNAVDLNRLYIGINLNEVLEGPHNQFELIVTEDCAFLLSEKHLICIRDDCGVETVNQEIDKIKERQYREIQLLFNPTIFEWSDQINSDRFELLVRELLLKEDGVIRVRKIGAINEPDAGRDLEVEWAFPDLNPFKRPESNPYVIGNILVQCKAYTRSVGKDKVNDIRDLIDMHSSNGYLLVVSSSITKTLLEYLKKLRGKGEHWVDWWTRHELEDKLRKNLDILHRFNDIVKIML